MPKKAATNPRNPSSSVPDELPDAQAELNAVFDVPNIDSLVVKILGRKLYLRPTRKISEKDVEKAHLLYKRNPIAKNPLDNIFNMKGFGFGPDVTRFCSRNPDAINRKPYALRPWDTEARPLPRLNDGLSSASFIEMLNVKKWGSSFKVKYHGDTCVMKVMCSLSSAPFF